MEIEIEMKSGGRSEVGISTCTVLGICTQDSRGGSHGQPRNKAFVFLLSSFQLVTGSGEGGQGTVRVHFPPDQLG